jgi:hypothetical protein
MPGTYVNISTRIYRCLLFAYPAHFRRRFGNQMLQTFRDCYRFEVNKAGFWLRTLGDLVLTAVRERADSSGREGVFMNNTRRDAMALLACAGIIVIAILLLTFGRKNEVSSILTFGYILDAIIVTGVIGNLVVFVLAKTTKLNRLHIALGTFAVVHAVLLLFAVLVAGKADPRFNFGAVSVGYLVSFLFWTGLHWAWQSRQKAQKAQSV